MNTKGTTLADIEAALRLFSFEDNDALTQLNIKRTLEALDPSVKVTIKETDNLSDDFHCTIKFYCAERRKRVTHTITIITERIPLSELGDS